MEAKRLGNFFPSGQVLMDRVKRVLCWWEVAGTPGKKSCKLKIQKGDSCYADKVTNFISKIASASRHVKAQRCLSAIGVKIKEH